MVVHADVRRDSGEDKVGDFLGAQQQVEVGDVERALTGLVDDRFPVQRSDLLNDLPARFTADQDPAAPPQAADLGTDLLRTPAIVGRQIGRIRPVPLAGVDHSQPELPAAASTRAVGIRPARVSERS
jgi:hypothetical protein